jgi:hypothetical protein
VVAQVRKRLKLSKQAVKKFEGEIFNLRKLRVNELEIKKQYQIKISNRFVALEKLSYSEDTERVWENIK